MNSSKKPIRIKREGNSKKNIANFDEPKFGYPCTDLHKPSDFLQNLIDIHFEPIVHMAAI